MAVLTGANYSPVNYAPGGGYPGNFGGYGGFDNGLASTLVAASLLKPDPGHYNGGGGTVRVVSEPKCASVDDLNAQCMGDIKAAIPLAEAQVQLAMAGLQTNLSQQATTNAQSAVQGQTAILLGQQSQGAALTAAITGVDNNVSRTSCDIKQAIHADGEATRALITSNTIAELNQRLTVAQQEALELRQRNDRDRDRHGIEINMTNNQNQLQQQQQLQFQAINHQIAGLCGLINQSNRATNSTVQVGNTGAATAGPQNNNPTNVVA